MSILEIRALPRFCFCSFFFASCSIFQAGFARLKSNFMSESAIESTKPNNKLHNSSEQLCISLSIFNRNSFHNLNYLINYYWSNILSSYLWIFLIKFLSRDIPYQTLFPCRAPPGKLAKRA